MAKEAYKFVQNRACEFFPCHKGVAEEEFNCLFCCCPLYALGGECGGDFVVLENGVKSCENCTIPHGDKGYAYVNDKFKLITERIRETDGGK